MALIRCPECGQTISDKAKACIHCGYPLDYEENFDDEIYDDDNYHIQLRTYQTPFTLEQYDNEGNLSGRYSITDIHFGVNGDELRIFVQGRKIYQARNVLWSLCSINWTLVSPSGGRSYATETAGRISVGESFIVEITDYIYESGTYILTLDID